MPSHTVETAGYFELSKVPVALRFVPIIIIENKFVPVMSLSFTKQLFCQYHMPRSFLVLRKTEMHKTQYLSSES